MSEPKVKSPGIKISGEGIAEMEPYVLVTRGLLKSDKKCMRIPISKVEKTLAKYSDLYERTNPTPDNADLVYNRVYIDLDGDAGDIGKREFDDLVESITNALRFGISDACIMESSQHQLEAITKDGDKSYKNKLSFRIQFTKKHGTKAAIEVFVTDYMKTLSELLSGCIEVMSSTDKREITPSLSVDMGVYNPKGRKMRMFGSSKDYGFYDAERVYHELYTEDRPNKIVSEGHTVLDTLITYIPEDSEALPEPVVEEEAVVAPKPKKKEAADPVSVEPSVDEETEAQNALLVRAIMGLPAKYYTGYEEWLRVGFVCFNEGLGLKVWDDFSKQSAAAYKKGACADKWATFTKGALSQASIWKWLKASNPVLYAELIPARNDFKALVKCYNHAEIAKFFYNLKPDAYLYNETLKWYQLMPSNTWRHCDKVPPGLLNDIWVTMKGVIAENWALVPPPPYTEETKAYAAKFSYLSKEIGNKHFLEGVAGMLHSFYNNDDLEKLMDESRNLFAFSDKVVDLSAPTPIIRDILPSDFVSLHTGYKFPTKSDPTIREKINKWLASIWEDDAATREYVLRTIAVQLHGTKRFEEFYVWTGRGRNGKGLLSALIKRAFGDYFHEIPHAVITKKIDKQGAANPDLPKTKGKRFVQTQEPEADDVLQIGVIKEYTGGGTISARLLNQNPVQFQPQFGLWLQCNGVPKLNKLDDAISERLQLITFPLMFVETPTQPHQRPRNIELKPMIEKSDEWRAEFVQMLLEIYPTIKSSLSQSPRVIEDTKAYLNENDPIKEWLPAHYEKGMDPTDKRFWVPATEILMLFKETNPEVKAMTAAKLKSFMERSGITQERKSNTFKTQQLIGAVWEPVTRPAGSYYLGLRHIEAHDE